MTIIIKSHPKHYGVLLSDLIGIPFQDRQGCADTIEEAHAIALQDMQKTPHSCAKIYYPAEHGGKVTVAEIDTSGKIRHLDAKKAANA